MNKFLKNKTGEKPSTLVINKDNTECDELTQIPVVQQAFNEPGERSLLEKIFKCINSMFRVKLINRIVNNFHDFGRQVELEQMAKDAFQDGLTVFFTKTNINGLRNEAKLETIIHSYVIMQFMKLRQERLRHATALIDERTLTIGEIFCVDEHVWDSVCKVYFTEKQYKLHKAIRMLKTEWQKILYWVYFDGLSSKEIAIKLKIKPGSVDNILTKARRQLKEILISKFNFHNLKE
jgi:RNA polymerase sigma factor (sigma-70 family)